MFTCQGKGLVNKLINTLPFEAHIPGYRFCGPGTKLEARLARGERGVNPLDESCRTHDIAYANSNDLESRHKADRVLEEAAWARVKARDSKLKERVAAWAVTNIMKTKRKLGMGVLKTVRKTKTKKLKTQKTRVGKGLKKKKKRCGGSRKTGGKIKTTKRVTFKGGILKKLSSVVKHASNVLSGKKLVQHAVTAARHIVKAMGGKKKVKVPRVIPVPRPSVSGGILPLLPIFAGLSALGALAGGTAQVVKSVTQAKDARKQLEEANRHNKTMEAIALGNARKTGGALYLKPYKKQGMAIYLKPYRSSPSKN